MYFAVASSTYGYGNRRRYRYGPFNHRTTATAAAQIRKRKLVRRSTSATSATNYQNIDSCY
jgi:hypothetical protein